MSDIKLFQVNNNKVTELEGKSVAIEKTLQTLIEKHLDSFLGVTFLASEYSTGIKHGGRIDTLGIDENNCPVIIEYKRASNENVVNQGLYYLDWLLDHKAEFQMLLLKKKQKQGIENIEWENARLICIAGDYTKYDSYAVEQMNRNIELIRYKKYNDLLLLELINAVSQQKGATKNPKQKYSTVSEFLEKSSSTVKDIFEALRAFLLALGEDVQMKELLYYYAFKRIKNFASVEIHPQTNTVVVFVKLNVSEFKFEKGFTRDVSKIGHLGTGDIEIKIKDINDLEKAKPYILKSYEMS